MSLLLSRYGPVKEKIFPLTERRKKEKKKKTRGRSKNPAVIVGEGPCWGRGGGGNC